MVGQPNHRPMNTPFSRREFLIASGAGLAAITAAGPLSAATAMGGLPRRKLGKTGFEISAIGFGGGSRYMAQEDSEVAEKMLHNAVELGINYFDTAFDYTKDGSRLSIQRYGKFLVPTHRKQIYLAAKLAERDAESAKKNFDIMLKELGTDRLDVLHFHNLAKKDDVDKIVAADGALKFYRSLKDQGVIKAIGITGHSSGSVLVDGIKRIEPDVVMCPQNPAHSGANSGGDFVQLIPATAERNIGLIAMKSTARTALIDKNGVTAEQLVRYALSLPVASVVVGMANMPVIESCVRLAKAQQPMPANERKQLEEKLVAAYERKWLPYMLAGYTECPAILA